MRIAAVLVLVLLRVPDVLADTGFLDRTVVVDGATYRFSLRAVRFHDGEAVANPCRSAWERSPGKRWYPPDRPLSRGPDPSCEIEVPAHRGLSAGRTRRNVAVDDHAVDGHRRTGCGSRRISRRSGSRLSRRVLDGR